MSQKPQARASEVAQQLKVLAVKSDEGLICQEGTGFHQVVLQLHIHLGAYTKNVIL